MKLRYKIIILFISLICVLSVVTGTYSIVQMKSKIIEAAQSKLLSDLSLSRELLNTQYPGEWSLKDGQLCKGEFVFNNQFELVDRIGELTGDTVTIFQGDTRIATNVIQEDGNRAVYTQVSEVVAGAVLTRGETYVGKANVVGTWNQAVYEPITNADNEIIGIWYVGVPNTLYDKIAADFQFRLILFTALGILVSIVIVWFFSNKIFNPLSSLEAATQEMAAGDLTASVSIKSKDEIGKLANAFQVLLRNFNDVLHHIVQTSYDVSAGSQQVSDSSMSLAQGASEQASAVEELTASMEEFATQMHHSAENVEKISSFSDEAKKNAEKSSLQMREMQNAIMEINQTSHDISSVIKVIDNIAFQTNILSLNASVEAASAGSMGRGFAVVAEEVRNLAMQVAKAVNETTILIENSLAKVEKGTKIVDETAETLNEIIQSINQMAEFMEQINDAARDQSIQVQQINQGIGQVSMVIQNTSAISQETAAASSLLREKAEDLDRQVHRFKLE